MKIERAKLEVVISIKVVKGDGTPKNPVRAMRIYFLPNGTFIGEVDESSARCVMDDNSFRVGIGGAPVHYDISLNSKLQQRGHRKACRHGCRKTCRRDCNVIASEQAVN